MSSFQMFLALGAMILLSLVIINVNKNSLLTEDVMYDSNFGITATSIGSSIIEDASLRKFDHITDTMALQYTDRNLLTAPGSLGPDPGEDANDPKTFNDFDDYNGYNAIDSSMPTARFNVKCKVVYVDPDTPNEDESVRTFHKKITVWVSSSAMKDTIIQSTIFSYWYIK